MVAPRRRPWSPSLLVRRRALTQGVLGNDRLWRAIAAVMFGASFLKRTLGRTEEIVTVERLRPGQTIVLRAIPYVSRRARRRAARAR
jgi:hypothetical protein